MEALLQGPRSSEWAWSVSHVMSCDLCVGMQYMEPEPEWMEFGPTDRFDVIELKGFDDQDAEEGMLTHHICPS